MEADTNVRLRPKQEKDEKGNELISFIMFEIWDIIQWNKVVKITLGHGKMHILYILNTGSC